MRRSNGATGLLVAAILCLCLPAAAQAEKTFKAGPVRYVLDDTLVAPSASNELTVHCNPETRVSAGGFGLGGQLGDASLTSTNPADGGDLDTIRDDGWRISAYNSSSQNVKLKLAEVCLSPGIGSNLLSYQSLDSDLPPGLITSAIELSCLGERVVGGGVQIGGTPSSRRVEVSGPFSDQGWQHPHDAGWKTRASTQGPATITGFAVCMPAGDVAIRYRRAEAVIRGAQTKRLIARCPGKKGWRVVGGGVVGYGLRLKESLPWDSKDKRKVPEDGWAVRVGLFDQYSVPVVATATAICLKKKK